MLSSSTDLVRERIQDFRKMRHVTQADLAEVLNLKRGSYQARESKGEFAWEEIEQIADFFEVSPYFLRYGIEEHEIKELADLFNGPSRFMEPNYTIFDKLENIPLIDRLFSSFLNLNPEDQKRLKRYIESQIKNQNK